MRRLVERLVVRRLSADELSAEALGEVGQPFDKTGRVVLLKSLPPLARRARRFGTRAAAIQKIAGSDGRPESRQKQQASVHSAMSVRQDDPSRQVGKNDSAGRRALEHAAVGELDLDAPVQARRATEGAVAAERHASRRGGAVKTGLGEHRA